MLENRVFLPQASELLTAPTLQGLYTLHFQMYGAEDRTRTDTAFATTPSRWRVYQFHHFGITFKL